jgi:hypothetical protein
MADTSLANAQAWRIVNAHAFLPDGLVAGAEIATEGAVIGDPHGDAFERRLMPRPDVFFPDDRALRAARYRPPARRQWHYDRLPRAHMVVGAGLARDGARAGVCGGTPKAALAAWVR